MKQAGTITGVRVDVSPKQLGYDVCCFIGVILKSAKDYPYALKKLDALDEVVEAYYTTGSYSTFIKVMCRSIDALQQVFTNKIQTIDEIQSTETLRYKIPSFGLSCHSGPINTHNYPRVDPSRYTAYNIVSLI